MIQFPNSSPKFRKKNCFLFPRESSVRSQHSVLLAYKNDHAPHWHMMLIERREKVKRKAPSMFGRFGMRDDDDKFSDCSDEESDSDEEDAGGNPYFSGHLESENQKNLDF